MGISKNWGTPKSSILIGFSTIFTIHFLVVPLFLGWHPYVFYQWGNPWSVCASYPQKIDRIQSQTLNLPKKNKVNTISPLDPTWNIIPICKGSRNPSWGTYDHHEWLLTTYNSWDDSPRIGIFFLQKSKVQIFTTRPAWWWSRCKSGRRRWRCHGGLSNNTVPLGVSKG